MEDAGHSNTRRSSRKIRKKHLSSNCQLCHRTDTDDMLKCNGCHILIHYECSKLSDFELQHVKFTSEAYLCPTCKQCAMEDVQDSQNTSDLMITATPTNPGSPPITSTPSSTDVETPRVHSQSAPLPSDDMSHSAPNEDNSSQNAANELNTDLYAE